MENVLVEKLEYINTLKRIVVCRPITWTFRHKIAVPCLAVVPGDRKNDHLCNLVKRCVDTVFCVILPYLGAQNVVIPPEAASLCQSIGK
jgi:hypothetical protein